MAADNHDLINFKNHDTLHGKFIGFTKSGKIIWRNNAADKNIAFTTPEVRKIVINKGKPIKEFTHKGFIELTNNDKIPGKFISYSNDKITINTDYSGTINIPKKEILNVHFNPTGHHFRYSGPFSKDEKWLLKYADNRDTSTIDEKKKSWQFKNFSLTHKGDHSAILKKLDLPEKFKITFNAYTNQFYYPSLVLMADLKIPKNIKAIENNNQYSNRYGRYNKAHSLGNCILISLSPTRSTLNFHGFNDKNTPELKTLNNIVKNTSSDSKTSKTAFEVRCDKSTGATLLYANGKMVANWNISSVINKLKGSYIGFNISHRSKKSNTAISDLTVSQWNGIQDSDLSLEHESRDVVLLDNITDRYSGEITSITNKVVEMKSDHGELTIPTDQIHSATFQRATPSEPLKDVENEITIHFYGTGSISGKLVESNKESVTIESSKCGKLNIKTEFIHAIEFSSMDEVHENFD